MKKLINRPEHVVEEMIQGLLAMHPELARLSNLSVLLRADTEEIRNRQVTIISGGGSGHEPAHAGYVGAGMLTAAVAGEVYTSPSVNSIFAAIKAVAGKPGVLLIVKNYTGDRLNFGLAAEMARAEGIPVEIVVVADDVALAATQEHAGRRGIAGTVLVHKVAGAASAEGKSLPDVAAIASATAASVATIGVSLSAGIIPAVGKPSFTLGDSEIELGLGIHGEPGVCRMALEPVDQLAHRLLSSIRSDTPLAPGDRVAVLVNNLGATTNMELAIFSRAVIAELESQNVIVERAYNGTFLSALDTAGVSLSILRVDDDRLKRLDAPTSAPSWPNASARRPGVPHTKTIPSTSATTTRAAQPQSSALTGKMQRAIVSVCRALIDSEERLTDLDRSVGDGDLGINLARGANAIEAALPAYPLDNPADTLKAVGLTLQDTVGGSSGVLYGVLFIRAANSLQEHKNNAPQSWAKAVADACQAVSTLGGAKVGDRTMLDALVPFSTTFDTALERGESLTDAFAMAVSAAKLGAEATRHMLPRRGRSSYLGDRALGHPDPGAIAVSIWLDALATAILKPDSN